MDINKQILTDYIILDIETTGLDRQYDQIIELSAIKIKNNNIVDEFSELINPRNKINSMITKLTGITNEMLENKPFIEDVFDNFVNFIENYILIAHNTTFDLSFLNQISNNLYGKSLKNSSLNTIFLTKRIIPDLSNYKLKTILDFLGICYNQLHRSLNDCKATHLLLEHLKNHNDFNTYYKFYLKDENEPSIHKRKYYHEKQKEINVDASQIIHKEKISNKYFVFTGELLCMYREDAYKKVLCCGGYIQNSVTLKTNYLIVGQRDKKSFGDTLSGKEKRAIELIAKGTDINIITESDFLELIC